VARLVKERGSERDEALKLTPAIVKLPYTSWRVELLGKVVPVLTTDEAVGLSTNLDSNGHHDLIERLVDERGTKKREEAVRLLATTSSLEYTSWRNEHLSKLYPHLTTDEVLAATDLL